MTARERIENLTNSWYGFAIATGLLAVVSSGFSIFTMVWRGLIAIFALGFIHFFGKRLLNRSSLTRSLLLGVSVLGTVFGGWGIVKLVGGLVGDFSLGNLIELAVAVIWAGMYIRSFRVLTESSVKSYIDG